VSDFGFVAGVTGVFFLLGVAFGVLAVIAASALRTDAKRVKRKRARSLHDDTDDSVGWPASGWPGGWTDTTPIGWEEPPGSDEGGEDGPGRR
jgi:hypothetical protein